MVEVLKLESAREALTTGEIGRWQVEVETGRQSRGLIIRQERRVADKGEAGGRGRGDDWQAGVESSRQRRPWAGIRKIQLAGGNKWKKRATIGRRRQQVTALYRRQAADSRQGDKQGQQAVGRGDNRQVKSTSDGQRGQ